MKAILEFNLDNKDDKMAHLRAIKSLDMACVLFELTHNLQKQLRNKIDSSAFNDTIQSSMIIMLDEVFDEINRLMESNNVNLDELIE